MPETPIKAAGAAKSSQSVFQGSLGLLPYRAGKKAVNSFASSNLVKAGVEGVKKVTPDSVKPIIANAKEIANNGWVQSAALAGGVMVSVDQIADLTSRRLDAAKAKEELKKRQEARRIKGNMAFLNREPVKKTVTKTVTTTTPNHNHNNNNNINKGSGPIKRVTKTTTNPSYY